MTPQQRRFVAGSSGPLATYKDVMVGDKGWGTFAAFEMYRLLFGNLESILGVGARMIALPRFLKSCGKNLVIGHGCTFRQPHRITFGKKVILDDFCLVDVRTKENMSWEPEVSVGDFVYLGRYSIVSAKYGRIHLGNGCNVGAYSRIATQSSIEIGQSVLIASYCYIGPGNHGIGDVSTPIMEQEMDIRGGVKIGDNTWIGTRSTILDGVTIGRDAVVGAHSLVREDVPDRAIVAGSPAKLIRYRE